MEGRHAGFHDLFPAACFFSGQGSVSLRLSLDSCADDKGGSPLPGFRLRHTIPAHRAPVFSRHICQTASLRNLARAPGRAPILAKSPASVLFSALSSEYCGFRLARAARARACSRTRESFVEDIVLRMRLSGSALPGPLGTGSNARPMAAAHVWNSGCTQKSGKQAPGPVLAPPALPAGTMVPAGQS